MSEGELPQGGTVLSKDQRPIFSVYWPHEGAGYKVGEEGCTRIVAYDESGEMSFIPWVAVFFDDELRVRIPAHQISINYGPEKTR